MFTAFGVALVLVAGTWPAAPAALSYLWGNGKGPFVHKYEVVKFNHRSGWPPHQNGRRFRTMFWAARHDRRMNKLYDGVRKQFGVSEITYFYTVKPLIMG